MASKKSTPPPRAAEPTQADTDPDDGPAATAEPETDMSDVLASRGVDRPPAPLEVDASRLTPRPVGPFKGGIILNSRGRCAVCGGVGDHVHTRPGMEDHVHRGDG